MAIEATIAKGYAWRMIIIAVASTVFGLWGVYDYAVAIPRGQEMHDRMELLQICKTALESDQTDDQLNPEALRAAEAVVLEINTVVNRELMTLTANGQVTARSEEEMQEKLNDLAGALRSGEEANWLALMQMVLQGLGSARELPLTEENYPEAHAAYVATENAIESIGQVTAPGKYDRLTQWAFIACLPCAPYFFWLYVTAKRRIYKLDDDGTLHMPEAEWTAEQIAGIDMSRWMAKSIATISNSDGAQAKLDDYKYRNMHRIVGALAVRFHPDEWDDEARPLASAETESGATEGNPSAEAAPGTDAG